MERVFRVMQLHLLIVALVSLCINCISANILSGNGVISGKSSILKQNKRNEENCQLSILASAEDAGEEYAEYRPPYNPPPVQQQQQFTQQAVNLNPFLKQASTASIGVIFALLSWRVLTAYEMSDGFKNSLLRFICVNTSVLLLFLNLGGFLINFFRPLNFKDQLKSILIANVLREWVELVYNLLMILAASLNGNSNIPREVYFGRFFMNVWWSILSGAFVKSRWVKGQTAAQVMEDMSQQQQQQQQAGAYRQPQQQAYYRQR